MEFWKGVGAEADSVVKRMIIVPPSAGRGYVRRVAPEIDADGGLSQGNGETGHAC